MHREFGDISLQYHDTVLDQNESFFHFFPTSRDKRRVTENNRPNFDALPRLVHSTCCWAPEGRMGTAWGVTLIINGRTGPRILRYYPRTSVPVRVKVLKHDDFFLALFAPVKPFVRLGVVENVIFALVARVDQIALDEILARDCPGVAQREGTIHNTVNKRTPDTTDSEKLRQR